jgi:hypothetical protein
MLTIVSFCFLHYKLQFFLVCHVHYISFTCGKGLSKKIYFETYFEFLKNSTTF